MKSKKLLAGCLSVGILSLASVTGFAANIENIKPINDVGQIKNIMPIHADLNAKAQSYFNSFTGVVKEIRDLENRKAIMIENKDGSLGNMIVSEDTYIVDDKKIEVGATITGFYKANAPMIMIYPPQYNAEVIVVNDQEQNLKVDEFDKDLISADYSLKLNISKDTKIITQDEKEFTGDLQNRKLIVFYDISTRSIPAQTTPTKIIVLFEKAVTLPEDISTMDIIVNNEKIEAPIPYTDEQGMVMVPVAAISKALGYDLVWNEESQSVMIGKGISLTIGKDQYNYMKTAPIELGTAPTIVKGRTYVPLSFFKKVIPMNNAYVLESQIIIDNEEIMD
ncbi:copper amine oxidase N-terminal domain-containing protein [Inediibacterium massiliense]|uniref:copper amine oxidase N-terminal domain-containing protein n=1 Tax=Inediibacterium massiliense TaxID=1658111 RepID=UPI0006B61C44|nr:copper amine oxidase N-terminal domain-containing protein [Inediibacterium massiliense]